VTSDTVTIVLSREDAEHARGFLRDHHGGDCEMCGRVINALDAPAPEAPRVGRWIDDTHWECHCPGVDDICLACDTACDDCNTVCPPSEVKP